MIKIKTIGLRTICALSLAAQQPAVANAQKIVTVIGGEEDRGGALDRPKFTGFLTGNRVLVIEERSGPYLKLFDRNGRLQQRIGRNGAGPGGFRYISTAAIDDKRARLAVFDPALRRVSYFALEDTLRFVGSSSLPFDISAACYLDGQLWVLGDAGNSAIVHRLQDSSGVLRLTQSGGTMRVGHPLDASPRFREQVVMGPIACDVKSGQVIAGTAGLGVVQLIPVRGGTASIQRIAGFQPLDYVAVDRGGLMIRRNESGKRDDLLALRTSRSGVRAIVGHQDAEQKDRGDYAWVGEFSVAKTGISAGARVRSIERDAAEGLLICTADAPYPLIRVVRASSCP